MSYLPSPAIELPSLIASPSASYHDFKRALYAAAEDLCQIHYDHGLNSLYVTITDKEYTKLRAADSNVPENRPTFPVKPSDVSGSAGAGTIHNHKDASIRFREFTLAMASLKSAILVACGPVIQRELAVEKDGLEKHTIKTVLEYLEAAYGTPTAADICLKQAEVASPFTNVATFRSDSALFLHKVRELDRMGFPLNELQQLQALTTATAHLPDISTIIMRYKVKNHLAASQRTVEAIKFVNQHLDAGVPMSSTSSSSSNSYANAAIGLSSSDVHRLVADAVAQAMAQHKPSPAAQQKPKKKLLAKTFYCFVHGSNSSHAGPDCRVMLSDKRFTEAQRTANGPI